MGGPGNKYHDGVLSSIFFTLPLTPWSINVWLQRRSSSPILLCLATCFAFSRASSLGKHSHVLPLKPAAPAPVNCILICLPSKQSLRHMDCLGERMDSVQLLTWSLSKYPAWLDGGGGGKGRRGREGERVRERKSFVTGSDIALVCLRLCS